MALRTVKTKYGTLSGVPEDGYTVFRGVPYAMPPVGDRRWRAPEKPEPWDGVRPACRFPAKCAQPPSQEGFYWKEFYQYEGYDRPDSEDCLYLNIWTLAESAAEGLPVAVWIHGGGYLGGYGSEAEFDGAAFAAKGVILVTVQYRLGVFGFLAHPWLRDRDEHKSAGNYGILDQIAAVEWVWENIEDFGGNPENITVFGQSAGGKSVQTLLSSPIGSRRIAKAVMQSGGGYGKNFQREMTLEEACAYGERLVEMTKADSLDALLALPWQELMKAEERFLSRYGGEGFLLIPNIDGYVLECGYAEAVDRKIVPDIPCMLGGTKQDICVTPQDLETGRRGALMDGCAAFSLKMEQLYNRPSWVYYFTRSLPGDDAGAFHSAELWYLFQTFDRSWRPFTREDRQLGDRMLGYWTDFMKTGNPNGGKAPLWRPCTARDPFVMALDV